MVAILSIVGFLAIKPLVSLRGKAALDVGVAQILDILHEARNATLSSREDQVWGVHFEESRAVLFPGTTFVEPNSQNKVLTLDHLIRISAITLTGGGPNVVFKRLTGETDNSGSVTIALKSDESLTRVVSIISTGNAEISQ